MSQRQLSRRHSRLTCLRTAKLVAEAAEAAEAAKSPDAADAANSTAAAAQRGQSAQPAAATGSGKRAKSLHGAKARAAGPRRTGVAEKIGARGGHRLSRVPLNREIRALARLRKAGLGLPGGSQLLPTGGTSEPGRASHKGYRQTTREVQMHDWIPGGNGSWGCCCEFELRSAAFIGTCRLGSLVRARKRGSYG